MSFVSRAIKDPFPGLSHWLGLLLSVNGLIALLVLSRGRGWHLAGCAIYGSSLVLLYFASALAHTVRCAPHVEDRLTRFDCMAIFLLIAGTYTPLCLVALRGRWGWSMLIAEWTMAILGIALVSKGHINSKWPRAILYLLMAWAVALVAIMPIWRTLSAPALEWLVAGGVIYSVGAVIFALDRPHLWPGRFMAHDLWHVMVILGSACHFVVIARVVAAT